VRKILYYFWNLELLFCSNQSSNIHVLDTDVKVISDFGEQGFGCDILIKDLQFLFTAGVIVKDILIFQGGNIAYFARNDKFGVSKLFLQTFNFLLKLPYRLDEELVHIV
jgi:hypothetical protein